MLEESHAPAANITDLLRLWKDGDAAAGDRVVPLIYDELKKLAAWHMRREHRPGTLQATALVNEVYLRLAQGSAPSYENRVHFFGVAARLMRQIMVDRARARKRERRGGDSIALPLDEALLAGGGDCSTILEVDEALTNLAALDARKARVVELRWFGGLEVEEVARLLEVSENTVIRDWAFARAWLRQALAPNPGV